MAQIENMEDALEAIGGFGKFQLFALIAIIYPELPGAILGMLPVYVSRSPEFWNCITLDDGIENAQTLKHVDVCSCNGTLERTSYSIVTEWALVCDLAWVADFITSLYMVGMFIGGFFGAQISDWIGRKRALYLSCILTLAGGIAGGFAPSAFMYAATRLLVGYATSSFLVVGAIYPMEFFTPRWRSLSGTIGPWGEGTMLLPVFAMYILDWKTLSWVASLPMLIMFIGFPFLPESPRWLIKNDKITEAHKTLTQIARWNGKPPLDEAVVTKLALTMSSGSDAADDKPEDFSENESTATKPKNSGSGYLQLIRDKRACLKVLNFLGIWFSNALIYYTIGYNTKNMGGDIHLNMVFQGLVDCIAFRTAPFGISWFGRKRAIIYYLVTGSLPLVGIVMMELGVITKNELALTVLSLVAKFFIAGGWSAIKCFTGESFPTTQRSSAVGICLVAASLGGVLAPQNIFLGTFNPAIPYFVLGAFSVFSAIVSFFLEETTGKPISESG